MLQDRQASGLPGARRPAGWLHETYSLLVSPKLAIGLLAVVLTCCVVGVTVVRGTRAGELIFATLWFNGLLVLLALSSAAAFFSRTWKRKLTLLSAGMILFHVSFAALLGGIVYNRLFFFDGLLRLTEGETLPNGRIESYDRIDHGRFFDFSRLRGETTLVKMHVNYKVDGDNKRAAYELAVADGEALVHRIIWITKHLDFDGVRFFCQKEGYSVLLVASNKQGREIFGAHVPLQSLRQPDESYQYVTGTATGISPFLFPPPPDQPLAELQFSYRPSTVAQREGEVTFQVRPFGPSGDPQPEREGRTVVGAGFDAGAFTLTPREIRYWVGINVRRDPGMAVILASLCLGVVGMAMVLAARVRQGASRRHSA
jgi:cytochrome c biogenesis protein ResB